MKAFVDSGSAGDTTVIEQKGTRRFRCTTAGGTETLTLTAVVHGSIKCWTVSTITGTDSAGGTYFADKLQDVIL